MSVHCQELGGKDTVGIKPRSYSLGSPAKASQHPTYAGEEQSAQRGVHNLQDAVPDEDAEYGKDEEHHHTYQEHAHARGKVIAGLEGRAGGERLWVRRAPEATVLS